MKKINFLVEHLGSCQLAYYLIRCGNALAHDGYQVIAFYDKLSKCVLRPEFPTMQMVESWAQSGITIATSIPTAVDLLDFPGADIKFFYVWDLEWMRGPQRMWGPLYDLFTHEDLKLIARTNVHAQVIADAFNRQTEYIIENLDAAAMKEIFANVSTTK